MAADLGNLSAWSAPPGARRAVPPAPQAQAPAAPSPLTRRARLFVDAQHGLGNRLRAIASAAAIAETTGHELVIVWQPDHHCAARFTDLFRYRGAVIDTAFPELFRRAGGRLYNYMENEPGAAKDAPVLADPPGARRGMVEDVYVRSAYRLVSPHLAPGRAEAFLRGLVPVAEVQELMRPVRRPNQVSVHVRMASGPGYDHLPHEAATNWPAPRHAEITAWRARSHARHFAARLDALIAAGGAGSLFLAADLPETYEFFAERYGARVTWLPRVHFDRSAEQMRFALADALLLGSAQHFLGSGWSSFSELAVTLSQSIRQAEFSGYDF